MFTYFHFYLSFVTLMHFKGKTFKRKMFTVKQRNFQSTYNVKFNVSSDIKLISNALLEKLTKESGKFLAARKSFKF